MENFRSGSKYEMTLMDMTVDDSNVNTNSKHQESPEDSTAKPGNSANQESSDDSTDEDSSDDSSDEDSSDDSSEEESSDDSSDEESSDASESEEPPNKSVKNSQPKTQRPDNEEFVAVPNSFDSTVKNTQSTHQKTPDDEEFVTVPNSDDSTVKTNQPVNQKTPNEEEFATDPNSSKRKRSDSPCPEKISTAEEARSTEINDVAGCSQAIGLYNCSARFNGRQDMIYLTTFFAQVSWFKQSYNISDEQAINELHYLYEGLASSWWRKTTKPATWEDTVRLTLKTFEMRPVLEERVAKRRREEEEELARRRALYRYLPVDYYHDEIL